MQERVWYGLTGEMKLETQQQVKIGAARRRSRVQGWRRGTSWGHLWRQQLRLQRTFSPARQRARSPAHLCLRPPESRPAGGVHGVSQFNILFFFKFPRGGSPTCLTIWPPPRFGICSMFSLSLWRMLTRRSSSMSFGNQNQSPHYNYYRVFTHRPSSMPNIPSIAILTITVLIIMNHDDLFLFPTWEASPSTV